MIFAVKLPVPLPLCTLCVRLLVSVPYRNPHANTVTPPSEVTLPDNVAPMAVTLLAKVVVTVGATAVDDADTQIGRTVSP